MKRYRFTVREHPDYGGLGFARSRYPAGEPLGGMAVAHDILEHCPNDPGTAEGEFLALGAALYIRGDSGYFQRKGNRNSTAQHLAADFPMIFRINSYFGPCLESGYDELAGRCQAIVAEGVKNMKDEEMPESAIPTLQRQSHIAGWIARGYVNAQRRYRHVDGGAYYLAYDLFMPIEEEADKLLALAEEGQVLTVSVDLISGSVSTDLD